MLFYLISFLSLFSCCHILMINKLRCKNLIFQFHVKCIVERIQLKQKQQILFYILRYDRRQYALKLVQKYAKKKKKYRNAFWEIVFYLNVQTVNGKGLTSHRVLHFPQFLYPYFLSVRLHAASGSVTQLLVSSRGGKQRQTTTFTYLLDASTIVGHFIDLLTLIIMKPEWRLALCLASYVG